MSFGSPVKIIIIAAFVMAVVMFGLAAMDLMPSSNQRQLLATVTVIWNLGNDPFELQVENVATILQLKQKLAKIPSFPIALEDMRFYTCGKCQGGSPDSMVAWRETLLDDRTPLTDSKLYLFQEIQAPQQRNHDDALPGLGP